MINALRGAVEDGLFQVFPVSAFGKHRVNGDTDADSQVHAEKPAQVNPLPAFGLEDGFVWACRCRDQIELSEYESASAQRAWWKVWQLFDSPYHTRTDQLAKRFPESSDQGRRIRQLVSRHHKLTTVQAVTLLLAVVLFGFAAFHTPCALVDARAYALHKPTLTNLQAAQIEQVDQAECWLEDYLSNQYFTHTAYRLVYSSDQANTDLVAIREWKHETELAKQQESKNNELAQQKQLWDVIKKASNEATKLQLAENLKEVLQNATYCDNSIKSENEALIIQITNARKDREKQEEIARKDRENETALQTVKSEFDSLVEHKSEVVDEYRKVRSRAEELPRHKDCETKELYKQRTDLLLKIDNRIKEIAKLNVQRKEQENSQFLARQQDRLNKANSKQNPKEDYKAVIETLERGLPYPDVAPNELRERYQDLLAVAHTLHDAAIRREEWHKLEEEYHGLMAKGKLREAAEKLVGSKNTSNQTNSRKTLRRDTCQSSKKNSLAWCGINNRTVRGNCSTRFARTRTSRNF